MFVIDEEKYHEEDKSKEPSKQKWFGKESNKENIQVSKGKAKITENSIQRTQRYKCIRNIALKNIGLCHQGHTYMLDSAIAKSYPNCFTLFEAKKEKEPAASDAEIALISFICRSVTVSGRAKSIKQRGIETRSDVSAFVQALHNN